jgi:tRNA-dihydrouridine synthase A
MPAQNFEIAIAPMIDWTHRHFRYFCRLLNQNVVLYTEMVVDRAIIHNPSLLNHHQAEKPLVLQIGGSDHNLMQQAVAIAEQNYDYDEYNINVGCPSDRVQSGCFGAVLMKQPAIVSQCYQAMKQVTSKPVSIKTRLGIDDYDNDDFLYRFIDATSLAGCNKYIIHARKALLQGLSPKQNRTIPPLQYERVYRLKERYPQLHISINGGITNPLQAEFAHLDGVMIGRYAYKNPAALLGWHHHHDDNNRSQTMGQITRHQVIESYANYIRELATTNHDGRKNHSPAKLLDHLYGLYHGTAMAKKWKNYLQDDVKTKLKHIPQDQYYDHVAKLLLQALP